MQQLLFGTFNRNKLAEIQAIVPDSFEVIGAIEFPDLREAEETADTLEGNALLKAQSYAEQTGLPCFADDTGLEVDALDGAPGVHSARYAGKQGDAEANIAKLLAELEGAENRRARFRTVIVLVEEGRPPQYFEGVLNGEIARFRSGGHGFGYDPVFVPQEAGQTLADMDPERKNQISHRALAVNAFVQYLNRRAQ
jgi:XTP/dITP diphosphohydrolase